MADKNAVRQMVEEVSERLKSRPNYQAESMGEREELYSAGREYNKRFRKGFDLLAHGNSRGVMDGLLTILTEGRLVHSIGMESYGSLGIVPFNWYGGHLDSGFGLFVGTHRDITAEVRRSLTEDNYTVSLDVLDAVVVPTPLADVLKERFPKVKIRGYKEYAVKLDNRCIIFDYYERKRLEEEGFKLQQKGFE